MAARTALDEGDDKGRFVRTSAKFREFISADHEIFKPEKGRYHLVISWACPWANRVAAVRKLKGLEDAIGLSVVHPTWQRTRPDDPEDAHAGWVFAEPGTALKSSTGYGEFVFSDVKPLPTKEGFPESISSVRDVYVAAAGGDPTKDAKKYTVPLLWDTKTQTIVNNESGDLIVMLNEAFNEFATNDVDLNPVDTRDEQEAVNEFVYPNINNGVYRCGFAKTQFAYDEAVTDLYEALAKVETILAKNRYLCGDVFTLADIRLFMTLIRFDEVYVVYFKTNVKAISQYPNLHNYCREIYQMLGPDVINMDHIKTHYFTSHPNLNYYAIIPKGPGVVHDLSLPHDRDASPSKKLAA